MIGGIAALTFVPLLAISIVHLMWAFGSTWPAGNQKVLARTVAGFRGIEKMPPRVASLAVAIFIFCTGLWALAMSDPTPSWQLTAGGILLTLIFAGRGFLRFTARWRALTPEEPFASLDRKIYSPLCLAIGSGFLTLVIWRLL